jgi:hypothetical protein
MNAGIVVNLAKSHIAISNAKEQMKIKLPMLTVRLDIIEKGLVVRSANQQPRKTQVGNFF